MNKTPMKTLFFPSLLLIGVIIALLYGTQASSQSIIRSDFDHDTTTFRLEGAHMVTSCASCHSSGVFSGTPLKCNGCHRQGSRIAATYQPARHILVTQQCESCHSSQSWSPVLRVDHTEVVGTCASCHNNRIVNGKPSNHLPTSDMCEDCHRSVAWTLVLFDHSQALANCSSCHDGIRATGKHAQHLQTNAECDSCHNTVAWQ